MKAGDKLRAALGDNIAESIDTTRTPTLHGTGQGGPPDDHLRGLARIRAAVKLPLDRVEPDPDQPRKEFDPDSLARLAESLKEHGQLAPILVRHDRGRGKWVVVAGERRLRAARLAGMETIAAVEWAGPGDPLDDLATQLVENLLREDLKPVEQAEAFQRMLLARGWTQAELAKRLHVSTAVVSRAMALLTLPADIRQAVDAGEIPRKVAAEIAKAPAFDQHRLAAEAQALRTPAARAKNSTGRIRIAVEGGEVTVKLNDPAAGNAQVLAALNEAAKRMRAASRNSDAA